MYQGKSVFPTATPLFHPLQDSGRRPSWFSSLFSRSTGGNPAHSAGRSPLTGAPANITGVADNVTFSACGGGGDDAAGGAGASSGDEAARKTHCLAEVSCAAARPKLGASILTAKSLTAVNSLTS